jgi:hypothetical protein
MKENRYSLLLAPDFVSTPSVTTRLVARVVVFVHASGVSSARVLLDT